MFFTDAVTLFGAFAAAYYLRVGLLRGFFPRELQSFAVYLVPGTVVVLACLVSIVLSRLYEDRRYLSRLEHYTSIVKALSYAVLVSLGLAWLFKQYDYSRGIILLFWAAAAVTLVLERSLWHFLLKYLRRRGLDSMPVAVLGIGGSARQVERMVRQFPELGYRVTSRLEIGRGSAGSHMRRLEDLVGTGRIAGVLMGVPTRHYHRAVPYMAWCEEHYVPHHRFSAVFDAYHGSESVDPGMSGVESRPVYHFAKRVIDEILALALLVVSLPLWAVIAVAIKAESSGPVLFIQDRVGRHGRIFRLLKFRTMYAHAPRYALTVRRKRDPRVTRVGWWLRRTSLDELPQLLNILRGEMSFVGPRPEMPFMVKRNEPVYQKRLMVLPGLTGFWQAVARHEPLEESLRYDLYYIQHRSLVFDLIIVARTFLTVFSGRGAR